MISRNKTDFYFSGPKHRVGNENLGTENVLNFLGYNSTI